MPYDVSSILWLCIGIFKCDIRFFLEFIFRHMYICDPILFQRVLSSRLSLKVDGSTSRPRWSALQHFLWVFFSFFVWNFGGSFFVQACWFFRLFFFFSESWSDCCPSKIFIIVHSSALSWSLCYTLLVISILSVIVSSLLTFFSELLCCWLFCWTLSYYCFFQQQVLIVLIEQLHCCLFCVTLSYYDCFNNKFILLLSSTRLFVTTLSVIYYSASCSFVFSKMFVYVVSFIISFSRWGVAFLIISRRLSRF